MNSLRTFLLNIPDFFIGLVEANANLMPPSPSVVAPTSDARQHPSSTGAINKTNIVPGLLPPPQTSSRSSNRRSQYGRATTVEPSPVVKDSVTILKLSHPLCNRNFSLHCLEINRILKILFMCLKVSFEVMIEVYI